jgi:pSer/pThr/pTyr-binding forkhead associated (FHA) protein
VTELRPIAETEALAMEPDYIQLEVIGGPMDGERCRLAKTTVTLGRGRHSDFCLHLDPTVSTSHARIVREGTHFWLKDLESSNGTYIGDERIRQATLIGPGALFALGHTLLEFMPR